MKIKLMKYVMMNCVKILWDLHLRIFINSEEMRISENLQPDYLQGSAKLFCGYKHLTVW